MLGGEASPQDVRLALQDTFPSEDTNDIGPNEHESSIN